MKYSDTLLVGFDYSHGDNIQGKKAEELYKNLAKKEG